MNTSKRNQKLYKANIDLEDWNELIEGSADNLPAKTIIKDQDV